MNLFPSNNCTASLSLLIPDTVAPSCAISVVLTLIVNALLTTQILSYNIAEISSNDFNSVVVSFVESVVEAIYGSNKTLSILGPTLSDFSSLNSLLEQWYSFPALSVINKSIVWFFPSIL